MANDHMIPLPRVTFVDRNGDSMTVPGAPGDSVMETAKKQRIPGSLHFQPFAK